MSLLPRPPAAARARRVVRRWIALPLLLAAALLLAWWRRGPAPLPASALSPSVSASALASPAPSAFTSSAPLPLPAASALAPPPAVSPGPYSVPSNALPAAAELAPGTTRILVLGDSVASFLGMALRHRQEEARSFVAERGVGQCSIFEARTRIVEGKPVLGTSCSATWVADVAELHPDVTLVVQGGAYFGDQACEPAWLAAYARRIVELSRAMGPAAGRVVLARVPYPMGDWRHGNVLDRVDCFNAMLPGAAAAAHLRLLDLMGYLCPTRACTAESQGKPIRPDGLHFDGTGAEETARWVLRELRRVALDGGPAPSPPREQ